MRPWFGVPVRRPVEAESAALGRGGAENNHSTGVESPPPPPRVC